MVRQALKIIEDFSLSSSFIQYMALNPNLEYPLVNNCRSKQILLFFFFLLLALVTTKRIKGANGLYTIK